MWLQNIPNKLEVDSVVGNTKAEVARQVRTISIIFVSPKILLVVPVKLVGLGDRAV
jgi:hypothetical protein